MTKNYLRFKNLFKSVITCRLNKNKSFLFLVIGCNYKENLLFVFDSGQASAESFKFNHKKCKIFHKSQYNCSNSLINIPVLSDLI
ncbi:hypothetical protein D0T92_09685 [Neisseria zalophi]|uniref:Uncharacterized protein n=1 Tax=Neisseria zalophi TaxID=640030 RepID=A0A5J6PWW2_9NEIS|nr:hypothetical protein D0T92_09685 [Neisseria zalophi]